MIDLPSPRMPTRPSRPAMMLAAALLAAATLFGSVSDAWAQTVIRTFPSGLRFEYRWKLLELALSRTEKTDGAFWLEPYPEEVTQNRGMQLLQDKAIDVIALGTNPEREAQNLPVRIDLLRGMVGFRIFVIRESDQARIERMDEKAMREQLTFGLDRQWADLAVMRAGGFAVETASRYEDLFPMLAAGRFDAFPRGLNEAGREVEQVKGQYPQLAVEKSKALYFPFPIYFWVNKENTKLAQRIERGLKLALADGSFRKLFTSYHADEIALMKKQKRLVIRLNNPSLSADTPETDTSWWWQSDPSKK